MKKALFVFAFVLAGTVFDQALSASDTDPNSGTSTSGVTKVIRDPSTTGETSDTNASSGTSTGSGVSKVIRDPSTGGQTDQTKAGKGKTRHRGRWMKNTGKTQTQNQTKDQTHQRSTLQAHRVQHLEQRHQHVLNGGGAKQKPTPKSNAQSNAVLSDLRMKKNVTLVGWSPMGIPIYQFSYINQPNKRYQGTIAQAIARSRPDAIIWRHGLMWVDYSRLDVRMEELPPAPVEARGHLIPR